MTEPAPSQERLELAKLPAGSLVDVETRNRHYRIETIGGSDMRISGHPKFCPSPVLAHLRGSVDGEGCCDTGSITLGQHLVFLVDDHDPVTTTRVLSVHIDENKSSTKVH